MKKQQFYQLLIKPAFVLIACFMFIHSTAQTLKQKPFMWVPKEEGEQQIQYFKSLKLKPMSANAGLTGSLLNDKFFLGNFWGMIKYFTITFESAQYLQVYLGINSGKKAVLIFAPAESENQGTGLKYYYLPKSFDPANPDDFLITDSVKEVWTTNFIKSMALNTIGKGHPDNQYPNDQDAHKIASDTRLVTYCFNDILELLAVKDYFVSKGFDINNSLNGYLGSYTLDGVPRGKDAGRYINRIVVQFDLLDGSNKDFYLDNIPEFKALDTAEVSNCTKLLDNGQLCPTNCPPPPPPPAGKAKRKK